MVTIDTSGGELAGVLFDDNTGSSDNPIAVTMDTHKRGSVYFVGGRTAGHYLLMIYTNNIGKVRFEEGRICSLYAGEALTVTVLPPDSHDFVGIDWTDGTSTTDNPLTITMDSNKTGTVVYAPR